MGILKNQKFLIILIILIVVSAAGCSSDDSSNDDGNANVKGADGAAPGNGYTNTLGMEFVHIEAGTFSMGSAKYAASQPVHQVRLQNSFYISKYEVTQKQWAEIMGSNPSASKGDNKPIESVSWDEVQQFIAKLNEKEGTTRYRLPTEAEWEYAARAGTTTEYSFGVIDAEKGMTLANHAWFKDNSDGATHNVGQKLPNSWELYDIHGNVGEYVQDSWAEGYSSAYEDGSAVVKSGSTLKVARGGSWSSFSNALDSAYRVKKDARDGDSMTGFRLVMDA
ncbi:formylglycine-generating enzyme family protein [Methanolobus sp.]|uniref:formylglycine-generating enzyme family protein n=1 Tax=Methanolobus sp. TaxID=1874737 RepID=UPI0025CEB902|nr:formylglycine-generating enzyme family protein [Methanolobus sp.]